VPRWAWAVLRWAWAVLRWAWKAGEVRLQGALRPHWPGSRALRAPGVAVRLSGAGSVKRSRVPGAAPGAMARLRGPDVTLGPRSALAWTAACPRCP